MSLLKRSYSSLSALLVVLLIYVVLLVVGLSALFMSASRPAAAVAHYTVTVYETQINGRSVICTETHDHQTGTRSRAC